jgi:hypothetical protein
LVKNSYIFTNQKKNLPKNRAGKNLRKRGRDGTLLKRREYQKAEDNSIGEYSFSKLCFDPKFDPENGKIVQI